MQIVIPELCRFGGERVGTSHQHEVLIAGGMGQATIIEMCD